MLGAQGRNQPLFVTWTAALLWLFLASNLTAQTIPDQYEKVIRERGQITGLGSELFGDKVGLYMGDLEFVQKDLDIPGNNALSVSISRRFVVNSSNLITSRSFKDWELDIPHIHGVFAINSSPNNFGWEPTRCSKFFAPLGVSASEGVSYPSEILWNGTYVYIPGIGDQEILKATPAALPTPQDGTAYPLSTKDASIFSCLSSLAGSSSGTGEGFTMIRPDGTKYRFDHLVTRYASSLLDGYGKPIRRNEIWILPTSVADRFGNTVTYTWSGWQLISIVASDGRRIDVTGLPITSVTDGTRIWRYEYSSSTTPELTKVSLPDNSVWQYSLSQLYGERSIADSGACNSGGSNVQYGNTPSRTGTMIHPSGALGEFTVVAAKHGRSWVPAECKNLYPDTPTYEVQPQVLYNYRILQKKLTGPGLPAQGEVWSYVYGPPNHCWAPSQSYPGFLGAPNIVCNANSPVTKEVLVTSPDSAVTRYVFGNRYNQTEGRVLRIDFNWNGSSAGRTVQYSYHSPKAGPYLESFGYSVQPRGDSYLSNANMPEESVITEENGVLFKSSVNVFDSLARPTSVTKSSSPKP